MEGMPWFEKRRAVRLRGSVPIYYESPEYGKHGNGLTNDISESGVRMTVEEFIPKFSKISMRIALKPDKPVQLNANVRWVQRIAYSPRYQLGLEFENISHDTRRTIAEYVYSNRQGV